MTELDEEVMKRLKSRITPLDGQIMACVSTLSTLRSALSASGPGMPAAVRRRWDEQASWGGRVLSGARELLIPREASLEELRVLPEKYERDPEQTLGFQQARHLGMTAYITTTWAIYDRVANVCGRLHSVREWGDQNPKLCWNVIQDKRKRGKDKDIVLPFTGWRAIEEGYGWPVRVSYKIRNWLVHDGYSQDDAFGTVQLFDESGYTFTLSEKARSRIKSECWFESDDEGEYPKHCCLRAADPWIRSPGDVLDILEKYHAEMDLMAAALIRWSVCAFENQVRAFNRGTVVTA